MRMTLPPLNPTSLPRCDRRTITWRRSSRDKWVSEVSCTATLLLGIFW